MAKFFNYTYIDDIKDKFIDCDVFYCDTRDFCVKAFNLGEVKGNFRWSDFLMEFDNVDDFTYNKNEVYELLKNYEKFSTPIQYIGRHGQWRYMSFDVKEPHYTSWAKYLGGFKLTDDKYLMCIFSGTNFWNDRRGVIPLYKNIYVPEKIIRDDDVLGWEDAF